MSLTITSYNNFFKIKGSLNKRTVALFEKEFKYVFENRKAIILNLERLESIDKYGVKALAELHNDSIRKNKSLSIIGVGKNDLYQHFKSVPAA